MYGEFSKAGLEILPHLLVVVHCFTLCQITYCGFAVFGLHFDLLSFASIEVIITFVLQNNYSFHRC